MTTIDFMLEALNRLPEEDKKWLEVKRALRPNASERDIKRAYTRRCPEAKNPDLVAWLIFESTQAQIGRINRDIEEYWNNSDLGLFGTAQAASEQDKADFETYKKSAEETLNRLSKILSKNKKGWERWREFTGASIYRK